MNTKEIIDYCLKAIGEEDLIEPVFMTREEVLTLVNIIYQGPIARRLKLLKSYSYDGSDSAHTITDGVGTLPADFDRPSQVYDGDAPDNKPLVVIHDIADRVADTDETTQYFLPRTGEIWLFGKTPSSTVKMYYYFEPPALEDSTDSTPTYLPKQFHLKPFEKAVQAWYSTRNADYMDEQELEIFLMDILDDIERYCDDKAIDDSPRQIEVVW